MELVADRHLLWAAAKRARGLEQEAVLQLAVHLRSIERARALYVMSALQEGHEPWERGRLDELHRLLVESLAPGADATLTLGERHRAEATALVTDDAAALERARTAPLAYIARTDPSEVACRLRFIDPLPGRGELRIDARPVGTDRWAVDVVARDRPGLLAATTGAMTDAGLDIERAVVATWPDGAALESFVVRGTCVDTLALREAGESALGTPLCGGPLTDIVLQFDDRASPWHTVCEVSGPEEPGLLQSLAALFGASGATVRAATIASHASQVFDSFELTDANERKLSPQLEEPRSSSWPLEGFSNNPAASGVAACSHRHRQHGAAEPGNTEWRQRASRGRSRRGNSVETLSTYGRLIDALGPRPEPDVAVAPPSAGGPAVESCDGRPRSTGENSWRSWGCRASSSSTTAPSHRRSTSAARTGAGRHPMSATSQRVWEPLAQCVGTRSRLGARRPASATRTSSACSSEPSDRRRDRSPRHDEAGPLARPDRSRVPLGRCRAALRGECH